MEQTVKSKRTEYLRPIQKRVIVQCQEARCLGYLDTNGKWKSAQTKRELLNAIDSNDSAL